MTKGNKNKGEASDEELLDGIGQGMEEDPPPSDLVPKVRFAIELKNTDSPNDIPPN